MTVGDLVSWSCRVGEVSVGIGMAERVGFEPTVEFPLHTLSKRAPSTARTSLRERVTRLGAVHAANWTA